MDKGCPLCWYRHLLSKDGTRKEFIEQLKKEATL